MVPSRTYIKEGLWNGDKCEQPCQTVCGSRCFWTCSTFGHACCDWDTSSRQNEAGSFQSIITRCFVPLFPPKMVAQRITSHIQLSAKAKTRASSGRCRKVSTFFLTNRFSMHEILIKTDCLRRGRAQWGICIPSLFRLVHYFISEIPPCGFCQPENTSDEGVLDSHSASVARQMLAFEWDPLRDRHAPQGWRGRANYIDKHAWDSSFIRQPFQPWKLWVSQMNIFFFLH